MKTTQDIDQLFDMMNDSICEDLLVPEVDLKELDKKYQLEKLKENKSIRNRFIFFGLVFTGYLIFGKDQQTKINICIFLPFLGKMIWINHQGKKALEEQNKAASFIEFEEKKNQITEIFYNQFKRIRTPMYLALFVGACLNFYQIMKNPGMFEIVTYTLLTLLGCFITIKSLQDLIHKYKKQN